MTLAVAAPAAASGWSNPFKLYSGAQPVQPSLAENADGDAVAAWVGDDNGLPSVDASYRTAGGQFGAWSSMGASGSYGNIDPSAGIAGDGTATLAWSPSTDNSSDPGIPVFSRRAAGSADTWTSAAQLVKDDDGAAGLIVGASGSTEATLGSCMTSGFGVRSEWSDADWACVPNGDGVIPGLQAAAVLGDGSVLAVSNTVDSSQVVDSSKLQVLTLNAGASAFNASPATVVSASSGDDLYDAQMRVDSSGDVYLAYVDESSSNTRELDVATLKSGGTWSSPVAVSTALAIPSFSLAVDPVSGSAILAFAETDGDTVMMKAATASGVTAGFSSAHQLSSDVLSGITASATGAGAGAVAWIDNEGVVEASLLGSSGFGSPEAVSGAGESVSNLASGGTGSPTLLWIDDSGNVETATTASIGQGQAPTCEPASATVRHDSTTGVSIDLPCNVATGRTPTLTIVSPPSHGTLGSVDPHTGVVSGGSVTYVPDSSYHGADTFKYEVSDGLSTSPPQTATVTVTYAPPTCQGAQVYEQYTDAAVPLDLASACRNPEDWPLTWTQTSASADGQVTAISPDAGRFVYTPPAGFSGPVTLHFRTQSSQGLVWNVTVTIEFDITWWSTQGITVTSGGCLGRADSGSLITCWVGINCPMGGNCTVNGSFGTPTSGSRDVADLRSRRRHPPLARPFRVKVAAGARRKVPIALTRAGRAQLKRRGRLTLLLDLTIREGGGAVTQTRRIHIKRVKRSRRHHG